MIKKIKIEYCEANDKYDIFINDEYKGKHYTLIEAMSNINRQVISELISKYDKLKDEYKIMKDMVLSANKIPFCFKCKKDFKKVSEYTWENDCDCFPKGIKVSRG